MKQSSGKPRSKELSVATSQELIVKEPLIVCLVCPSKFCLKAPLTNLKLRTKMLRFSRKQFGDFSNAFGSEIKRSQSTFVLQTCHPNKKHLDSWKNTLLCETTLFYHPGRNYYKKILKIVSFELIFAIITRALDQMILYLMLLPLVCPCLLESMPRILLCKVIVLFVLRNSLRQNSSFMKIFLVIILAALVSLFFSALLSFPKAARVGLQSEVRGILLTLCSFCQS